MKRLRPIKLSVVVGLVVFLHACSSLERSYMPAPVQISYTPYCETDISLERFGKYCQVQEWAYRLVTFSNLSWATRDEMIQALDDSPQSMLSKVLLSQSEDTPYQHRLRAQNWITDLQTTTDKAMTDLLNVLIYQQNQQLLEFESAISILGRVNSQQAKTIAEQSLAMSKIEQELQAQKEKMQQLLNVEATMAIENRSEQE